MTIEEHTTQPYTISIVPDLAGKPGRERRVYLARHPELSGCMAQGDTPVDALNALEEARRDYIAALLDAGLPVPPPDAECDAARVGKK